MSELPSACRGLEEDEQEETALRVGTSELKNHGLATRAILDRASNGKNGDERRYAWHRYVPLHQIMLLARPEFKGSIRPTSENSDGLAPTRKNSKIHEFVLQLSTTGVKDGVIMKNIYDSYFSVANLKKQMAKTVYHHDARLGSERRHNQGRVDAKLSPVEILKQLDTMLNIMSTNGLEPVVNKIESREITMCREILRKREEDCWRTEDEKHLEADWIPGVVDRLIENKGITCQMVSTFSFALAVVDFVTSYVNRTQDYLRCMRRHFHEFRGVLRSLMPCDSKNFPQLVHTAAGAELHHVKDEQIADCGVVYVVIIPPLMRKLLKRRVFELEKRLTGLCTKPLGNQTWEKRQDSIEKALRALERKKVI